jgi:hypothetical protein
MAVRARATIIAASRQTNIVTRAPAAIVIAERLIEAYMLSDAGAAIVAAADYAPGNRREPCHDQHAHRPTTH